MRSSFYNLAKPNCRFLSMTLFLFFCTGFAQAQTASTQNYVFSTTSTGSLQDMSAGTTQLIGPNLLAEVSSLVPIGFDFWFMGERFKDFTVNTKGVVRLGTSYVSSTTESLGTPSKSYICALAFNTKTGPAGKVHSKVSGTMPNRVLTIEWKNMLFGAADTVGGATYQVSLFETSGAIELAYGDVVYRSLTIPNQFTAGFQSDNADYSFASVDVQNHTVSTAGSLNSYALGMTVPEVTPVSSSSDGNRRVYNFVPAVPNAPANLQTSQVTLGSMHLSWTDEATNELGYAIYKSMDNIHYGFVTRLPANATAYNATGLMYGAMHYWRVHAVTEGALSMAAMVSETTLAGTLQGIKTVGTGGDYPTLNSLFSAIHSNGLSGNLEVQMLAGSSVAGSIAFPPVYETSNFEILLYPTVPGLYFATNSSYPTLRLDGAVGLTIDGRVNQIGERNLVISNSNLTGYPAVEFLNDAQLNTIRYCKISSANPDRGSGTIFFGACSTGNTNNTIDHCHIGDDISKPANAIYSHSTYGPIAGNSENTVSNCNIFNYFQSADDSHGIYLARNNGSWIISGNRFYQTAPRYMLSSYRYSAISIYSGSRGGHQIINNIIGYAAEDGTGVTTYTYTSMAPSKYVGIGLVSDPGAGSSSIQGNIISGLFVKSTAIQATIPGMFTGIYIEGGKANIGGLAGNVIGATNGGTVTIECNNPALVLGIGVQMSSPDTVEIGNNTIEGMIVRTNHRVVAMQINSPGTVLIHNNYIYANTILGTNASFVGIYGNAGTQTITGVQTVTGNEVGGNTVEGTFYLSDASNSLHGIYLMGSVLQRDVSNNHIYDQTVVGKHSSSNLSGILISDGLWNNCTGNTIGGLKIHSLLSSPSKGLIRGIHSSGSDSLRLSRNKIFGLETAGTISSIYGIDIYNSSSSEVYNNLIGDMQAVASNNVNAVSGIQLTRVRKANLYNNTVYLEAVSSGANFGTSALFEDQAGETILRNNALINKSTAAGSGKTISYNRYSGSLSEYSLLSNNNIFYAGLPGAANLLMAYTGIYIHDLSELRSLVYPRDTASSRSDLAFLSTVGNSPSFLHLDPAVPSLAESGGLQIPVLATDYDAEIRQGNAGYTGTGIAPDIGADEFEGSVVVCSGTPDAAIIGPTHVCVGSGTSILSIANDIERGLTYQWAVSAVSGGPYVNLGTTSLLVTGPLADTAYYVLTVGCAASGLSAISSEHTIVMDALPVVTVTASDSVYCSPGNSVSLFATGAVTYTWNPSAGLTSVTNPIVQAKPDLATTYAVSGTGENGCVSSAAIQVSRGAQPYLSAGAVFPAVCMGDDSQLLALDDSPVSYTVERIPYAPQTDPAPQDPSVVYGDDVISVEQTLPFVFNLYGVDYTQLYVHANGYVQLGNVDGLTSSSRYPQALPSTEAPNHLIAGVYSDLETTTGSVRAFTTGTAPNRIYTIHYRNVAYSGYNSILNFQIQLYETSNRIDLHYGRVFGESNITDNLRTAGIENADGTLGLCPPGKNNQSWDVDPSSPEGWRFMPAPAPVEVTYIWSPADFLNDVHIANPLLSAISASTDYSVTVQEIHGCTATASVAVSAGVPLELTADVWPNDTVCTGSNVTLTADAIYGGMPYTYSWTGPNGFSSTLREPQLMALTAVMGGTYTVTVTDECGALLTSSVELSVKASPVVHAGPDLSVCAGELFLLSATGTEVVNYLWSPWSLNNSQVQANGNGGPFIVTGTAANGCQDRDTFVLSILPRPSIYINSWYVEVCPGDSLVLEASSDFPVSWNQGVQNGIPFVPQTTSYYTVTASNAACVGIDSVLIGIRERPVVDAGPEVVGICDGSALTLLAESDYPVEWNHGLNWNGQVISSPVTGVFFVSAYDGWCYGYDTVHVIVGALQGVSAGADLLVCSGMPVTLTAYPSGVASWDHGIQDGVSFVPEASGTYHLILQVGSCAAADEVLVTVLAPPQATVSSPDGLTAVAGPSGQVYQWVNCGDGALVAGANLVVFTPGDAGTYAVIVTGQDGCSDTSACLNFAELGIGEPSSTLPVALYPNPTNGKVTLSIGAIPQADVTVYDAQGKVISILKHLQDGATIDLGAFETGVYVIRVATEQGIHITRILKN